MVAVLVVVEVVVPPIAVQTVMDVQLAQDVHHVHMLVVMSVEVGVQVDVVHHVVHVVDHVLAHVQEVALLHATHLVLLHV